MAGPMSRRRLTAPVLLLLAVLAPPATAAARDRNHDRIPDRWERAYHLSLKVNQAGRDQDRDGVNNLAEYRGHTNPRKADSDGDGTPDGRDTTAAGDGTKAGPDQPDDTAPDDGTATDPAEADPQAPLDHVVSYVDGSHSLTLGRADGTTVTARIGARTLVACATVVDGPFQPCPPGALVADAQVEVGLVGDIDGAPTWRVVLLQLAPSVDA
jgi:hypothetical protein